MKGVLRKSGRLSGVWRQDDVEWYEELKSEKVRGDSARAFEQS